MVTYSEDMVRQIIIDKLDDCSASVLVQIMQIIFPACNPVADDQLGTVIIEN